MPDDTSANRGFEESLQDRGWRELSARMDREMPVQGPRFPRTAVFLSLIALMLVSFGIYQALQSPPTQPKVVEPLPDLAKASFLLHHQSHNGENMAALPVLPELNTPSYIRGGGLRNNHTDRSEAALSESLQQARAPANEAALSEMEPDESSEEAGELARSRRHPSEQASAIPDEHPGNRTVARVSVHPLSEIATGAEHLSAGKAVKTLPPEKSILITANSRMGDKFSYSGLEAGLVQQWRPGRWYLRAGGQFSTLDYSGFHAKRSDRISRENEPVSMNRVAFEEGAYRSYSDILRLAGKTYYGGLSASIGRNLYSGFQLAVGTELNRMLGGTDQKVSLTTDGAGETELNTATTNAVQLAEQGAISPWLWNISAGITWQMHPDWSMNIRYEQPINKVLKENEIAPDKRPDLYWIEVGLMYRLCDQ